ncbi:unnamed protein product [Peronospora farinosa]|uniref:Uncharacterized protein n=1 Tax=Peronospora farinosa TaxID=134698 RepID=A0AAV0TF21_9STRA|nr:unnamed protein product [Peronospora farinosa]CAI5718083.1 unnamed protein product [Peronospora farinosa]
MDVPSWHPANQDSDALRRLVMSGGGPTSRTEFKEVSTSTKEERQMVAKEENAGLGGGRGLLDPSDRLYLVEQTLLEQEAKRKEHMARLSALQTFRSNASKVQTQKPTMLEIPVIAGKKPVLSSEKKVVVVVKAKKRKDMTEKKHTTKVKKLKKMSSVTQSDAESDTCKPIDKQKQEGIDSRPLSKSPTTALLIEGYSSDDGQ